MASQHILLSEPQVSVLFAFNARMNLTSESVLDEKSLSVIDLSEVTGLSPKEVEDVISSLITAPHVLLQRVRNPRDSFTSSGFHSLQPIEQCTFITGAGWCVGTRLFSQVTLDLQGHLDPPPDFKRPATIEYPISSCQEVWAPLRKMIPLWCLLPWLIETGRAMTSTFIQVESGVCITGGMS